MSVIVLRCEPASSPSSSFTRSQPCNTHSVLRNPGILQAWVVFSGYEVVPFGFLAAVDPGGIITDVDWPSKTLRLRYMLLHVSHSACSCKHRDSPGHTCACRYTKEYRSRGRSEAEIGWMYMTTLLSQLHRGTLVPRTCTRIWRGIRSWLEVSLISKTHPTIGGGILGQFLARKAKSSCR